MHLVDCVTHETVQLVPTTAPCCTGRKATFREVLTLLKDYSHSGVLVCDGSALAGIFTERDALKAMARQLDLDTLIESIMTPDPITLTPASTIGAAMRKMALGGFRRLPIVGEDRRPLAVIDMAALVHYVVQYFPGAVYNLPPKVMACTPERAGA